MNGKLMTAAPSTPGRPAPFAGSTSMFDWYGPIQNQLPVESCRRADVASSGRAAGDMVDKSGTARNQFFPFPRIRKLPLLVNGYFGEITIKICGTLFPSARSRHANSILTNGRSSGVSNVLARLPFHFFGPAVYCH
jgi:hypothetical protein